jgi:uncharacterized protein
MALGSRPSIPLPHDSPYCSRARRKLAAGNVNANMEEKPPVRIAPELLDARTLRSVIEEFVTRDGTEMSDLETKIAAVHVLLKQGAVHLWFDPETNSCNILAT